MSILNAPHFHDEAAAYAYVEARIWPNGPICPHCGATDRVYQLKGKATRPGLYKCGHCRKQLTVKIGTVFESSHVPMHLWLQAIALLTASKKGMSSNQLHRMLGVTLKTAWFMSHRIRAAMADGSLPPLGGSGKAVEADETFIGRKKGVLVARGGAHKHAVFGAVERGGSVRTVHLETMTANEISEVVRENIAPETRLRTDEATHYRAVGKEFAEHGTVNHGREEYVDPFNHDIHTNTIEGYFSIFKRGMKGIYQHCGEQHLHRYLAEFDFRYNNRVRLGVDDTARADRALLGAKGKRLTYRTTGW